MTALVNSAPVRAGGEREVDFNIFLLIQELLSDQKHENQKFAKLAVLATIALKDEQYKTQMKAYEKEIEEMSQKVQEFKEAIESKKNASTPWWEKLGGLVVDMAAFALIGAKLGGPLGLAVGLFVGFGAFALAHESGNESGATLSLILSGFKGNGEDAERQKHALEIDESAKRADLKRQEATQRQNEISMTLQTEFEPIQSSETAVSNIITAMLKMFAKIGDFQGRT